MASPRYTRILTEHRPRLARRVLVYLGDRRLRTDDGIEVWPLDVWLDAVANRKLWP